jgi:hypothetical protein
MFDAFDFTIHGLVIQPQERQEFTERLVPGFDVLGHLSSGRRQRKPAITFVIDKAAAGEPADHIRNRRGAEVQGGGQICDPRVTFLLDQFLNPFEVIFCGLRAVPGWLLRLSSRCHADGLSEAPVEGQPFRFIPSNAELSPNRPGQRSDQAQEQQIFERSCMPFFNEVILNLTS